MNSSPVESVILTVLVAFTVFYAGQAVRSDFTEDVFTRDQPGNQSQTKGLISLLLLSKKPVETASKHPPPPLPPPPSCPPDQYETCSHRCTEHCDERKECERKKHEPCEQGCFCRPPLVRLYGDCVDPEVCRIRCPPHSSWRRGSSCTNMCNLNQRICENRLSHGCFCDSGYALIQNQCYPQAYCNCGGNQTFNSCGNRCLELCPTLQSLCTPPTTCFIGCFCLPGYVRVNTTTCLLPVDACP